jgi:AcrR family transcriptional regulator
VWTLAVVNASGEKTDRVVRYGVGKELRMPRTPAPGTRDRILDTAARLFQKHGARAVGMQQIVDECGCGKSLLYREFASKDQLVAAYLERCQREWTETMDEATRPHADDPAGQMVAIVRAVARQIAAADFRGCPFRISHAEFPDKDHPAHQVAVRHAKDLRARLRGLAEQARARDPRALADRVMLIIDGLYINGAMLGPNGAATAAVAFAQELVRGSIEPAR